MYIGRFIFDLIFLSRVAFLEGVSPSLLVQPGVRNCGAAGVRNQELYVVTVRRSFDFSTCFEIVSCDRDQAASCQYLDRLGPAKKISIFSGVRGYRLVHEIISSNNGNKCLYCVGYRLGPEPSAAEGIGVSESNHRN